jgi:hypothetical protein
MHCRRRDMKRIRRGSLRQRNVPHQCFRQRTHFRPLLKQRYPGQCREPSRCGLGVASLAFLHHQPRRVQVELVSAAPPFTRNLLVRCAHQITTRPRRQVTWHSCLDVNSRFHRSTFYRKRRFNASSRRRIHRCLDPSKRSKTPDTIFRLLTSRSVLVIATSQHGLNWRRLVHRSRIREPDKIVCYLLYRDRTADYSMIISPATAVDEDSRSWPQRFRKITYKAWCRLDEAQQLVVALPTVRIPLVWIAWVMDDNIKCHLNVLPARNAAWYP